ncbi:MAG: EMC3/TMCO1 family protein [Nitrososphaerales archaeon]
MIDIALISDLLYSTALQLAPPIGAIHPIVPNMINAALLIMGIAIALQFLYAFLRRKMTDLGKLKRIMKETTQWRKEYMDSMRKQDKDRIEKLNKKKQYINKLQMEMMQMNFRPMIAFMIPMLIIWWTALPVVFGNTVAVSPIQLNILGDWIPITCTKEMIDEDITSITGELETKVNEMKSARSRVAGDRVLALASEAKELVANGSYLDARAKLLQAYDVLNNGLEEKVPERAPRCTGEKEILLWAWYAITSIAFSGMVMKVTKTSMDMGI